MNKNDIINALAEATDLSKAKTAEVLDAFINIVTLVLVLLLFQKEKLQKVIIQELVKKLKSQLLYNQNSKLVKL